MRHLAEMNDERLLRRVAKMNRRSERQELQRLLYRWLEGHTRWGKTARVGNLRAGAKLLAQRISAAGVTTTAIRHLRRLL